MTTKKYFSLSVSIGKSLFNAVPLFCFLTSCGLLDQPELEEGYVFSMLDTARNHSIEPTYDFIAKPESVTIFPEYARKYVYTCTEYTTAGGISAHNNNYVASVTQPAERSFRICYSKAGVTFDLSVSNRNAFPGILNKPDSLLLLPIADSAYFFAFKDIDSKYILIYQTTYVPNDAYNARGCQIFKEGLGLLYERYYNGDPWHGDSKLALLKNIDDSSIDVLPIISRIMGMQNKCVAAFSKDSIVLSVHESLFDSILGKKSWNTPALLSIKSDTNLLFAPNDISQLYMFSPDTIITLDLGYFDTISISGYSYSYVNRIQYAFGGW